MNSSALMIRSLGQTGFCLEFAGTVVYVGPYLSNSVQEKEADDLVRLIPVPVSPTDVTDAEVISAVKAYGKIDMAFLPVNERNYYRERRGIVGNMSVREAFHFAEEIGASALVPTHWDMFAANCVFKEEIELLYKKISPEFELLFEPEMVE